MGLEEMKGAARLSLEVFMPLQGDHWGDRAELTHSTFRNFRQRREETIKQMETLGCQLSPTVHKRVEFVLCDDDALTSETKHVSTEKEAFFNDPSGQESSQVQDPSRLNPVCGGVCSIGEEASPRGFRQDKEDFWSATRTGMKGMGMTVNQRHSVELLVFH